MTDHAHHYSTVTVPVGFGGKSSPYVPDPAPTLLVELATVDRAKEEAKVAALLGEAEATAASVTAEAEAAAEAIRAEAAEAAGTVTANARADADAVIAAAEDEAKAVIGAADTSVAGTLAKIETSGSELAERAAGLEALRSELDSRDALLAERLAAVDAEVAEAATILSAAHREADSVLAEARASAEEILDSARQQAEDDARALVAEARTAAEHDPAVQERIAEIGSVHRIEVQVLHDREVELLERIADLEARVAAPPVVAGTGDESAGLETGTPTETPQDAPTGDEERTADDDESMSIDLDDERAEVTVRQDRLNGRHTSDGRTAERSPSAGTIVTHAPLIEQLSTSAFRAMPDERRGRRRR
ncbi:MAG: hypothetical protein WEB55_05320 [Acidimicrobiia bacterium]